MLLGTGALRYTRSKETSERIIFLFLFLFFFFITPAGSPPLTGSGVLRVVVLDVNDHSPEFSRTDYSADVIENQPAGTWIAKPTAVDKDEGLNARIR